MRSSTASTRQKSRRMEDEEPARSVLFVTNPYTTLRSYKNVGLLSSFKRYLRSVSKKYSKIYVLTMDEERLKLSDDGRIVHVPIRPPPLPHHLKIPYCLFFGTLKAMAMAKKCAFVRADGGTVELHGVLGAKLTGRPVITSFRYFEPMFHKGQGALVEVFYALTLTPIIKLCLKLSDKVIALTEFLKEFAMKMGVDERKILVIPILMKEEKLRPEAYDAEALKAKMGLSGKIVLFVGRLAPEKNVDILIRAFKGVLEELGDATLLIVGGGPLKPRLRELCKELGIANRVRFVGVVPREQVPEFLAIADVFVLPSTSEGLPKALLEALAMAKPVVATAAPGIIDVIKHGREGLLVPIRDVERLKRALLKVLKDEELARRLARNARETFKRYYSYEERYPELKPFIETFLTPYL